MDGASTGDGSGVRDACTVAHHRGMGTADTAIAALSRRQLGAFTWSQARAAGLPDSTIARRAASGRYERMLPGVLREACVPDSWEARAMAALLAIGGEAVLCRRSAARVLGLDVRTAGPLAVLVRTRTFEALPAVRVHRTRVLEDVDVTTVGALATTTATRTVADLAATLSPEALRRVVAAAVRTGSTDATALRTTIGRLGRFRGKRTLVALVDELHPLEAQCRSELESRWLRLVTAAGLAPTAMNHPVVDAAGRRRVLDAVYLPERIPVELDSRLAHGSRLDVHDDLRRENAVVLTGWRSFLRFSWDDVVHRPDAVVATVRTALDAAQVDRVSG